MASLHTSALVSPSIGVLRRPSAGSHAPSLICITRRHISKPRLALRFKREETVQVKKRWSPAFASSSSSSSSNASDGSNEKSSSEAFSRPPLLTVLAGVVVFMFLGCAFAFILFWLVCLIFNPPPLN